MAKGQYYKRINELGNLLLAFDLDGFGHLDAGLFFIAFMRNPVTQFIPMQSELAANDLLNEYITHTGSAVFACPPGLREGEYWGSTLLN